MSLTRRIAETIGADPSLTQSIRIDVSDHNEPTVTVTRVADSEQIGRIIQCLTWANYTLVENDELKRLRKGAALTASEREAIEMACKGERWFPDDDHRITTLRSLLRRLGGNDA